MKKLALVVCGLLVLASCTTEDKEKMGLVKSGPNEFLVTSRAPLTLPPDYDLRPVNENVQVMQKQEASKKVEDLSDAERKLLRRAGVHDVDAQ